jgi:hypothetical protein
MGLKGSAWRSWAIIGLTAGMVAGCDTLEPTVTPAAAPLPGPSGPTGRTGLLPPAPGELPRGVSVSTPEPMPAPASVARTTTNEKTTVSPDGRTVTTEKTTTTIGFSAPAAPAAPPAAAPAGFAVPPPTGGGGMAGVWTMHSSSTNQSCPVAFYGPPEATAGQAQANCGGGSLLTGVSGWSLEGNQLELTRGNDVAMTLNQTGPNRYQATAQLGILSTTITLFR